MKREYDLRKGKRGAVVPLPPEKVRITIRVERDIVDHFHDQVRKAHRRQQAGTEVRSVLREGLGKVKIGA
jgi:hypothetical protein